MAGHFLNRPDITDATKVADVTRPGSKTIRVDAVNDLVHISSWLPGPGPNGARLIADDAFTCARSDVPLLVEALLRALTKGLRIVADDHRIN